MSDFFLAVVFYAKPGQENELREDLKAIVEPSRRDEGNKRYDLFADLGDPRRFVFFEQWVDEAAQQKHLQTEHIRAFGAKSGSRVEKVEQLYKLSQIA